MMMQGKKQGITPLEGEDRRAQILRTIAASDVPISGSKLAMEFGVSRQVIVQDIALLKAAGEDILSTVRGYHCLSPKDSRKYIYVEHGREQMEEELITIVDNGGLIINTGIEHPIYGKVQVDMNISSRKDVKAFIQKSLADDFSPLSALTSGKHFHLVETQSPEDMQGIFAALGEIGILQKKSK